MGKIPFVPKIQEKLAKYSRFLPWISLLWGIGSGTIIHRDFHNITRLIIFSFGVLLVLTALNLFINFRTNKLVADGKHKSAEMIEWVILTILQNYVQYVIFFSLPFIYFSHAWFFLVTAVGLAAVSLWDPLWCRLVKHVWFQSLLVAFATATTLSFLFPILFPGHLDKFHFIFALTVVVCSIPWVHLSAKERLRLGTLVGPSLVIALVVASFLIDFFHPPLLSVWMSSAVLTNGVLQREPQVRLGKRVCDAELAQVAAMSGKLCCWTPLIAPRALTAHLTHEWVFDGKVVARIALPPAQGLDDRKAYRTWSCKTFPPPRHPKEIRCRVVVDREFSVGEVSLFVQEGQPHCATPLEPSPTP